MAEWLRQQWHPSSTLSPIVRIGCDGLTAITRSFEDVSLSPTQKQFDILSTIHASRELSPIRWRPRHMYGHQDDFTASLTWWERRNMECDSWAGTFRRSLSQAERLSPPNPRFFQEPAALFVGGVKHAHVDPAFIQEHVALPSLRAHWLNRSTISAEAESEIDWPSLGRAMRSLPPKLQRWTTKHTVGMCGVGKFLKIWGHETHSECPLCGAHEDHLHVPRCPDPKALKHWEQCIHDFSIWLDNQLTAREIKHALLAILREVRQPLATFSYRPYSTDIAVAIRSQRCIGCQGLLEGRLSSHWISLQQFRFRSIGSQRSARLWASRLSQQLIQIGFSMWEHRNSIKHSDLSRQAQARIRQADAAIHSQFDMGTADLPRIIRPFLSGDRRRVLRKSLVDKEVWLKLLRAERMAQRRSLRHQRRTLRAFLRCPRAPS